jgi:hypothetical protein
MGLDLTDDEKTALIRELDQIIREDRYRFRPEFCAFIPLQQVRLFVLFVAFRGGRFQSDGSGRGRHETAISAFT